MDAYQKDEFSHSLAQTLEFYGKELSERDFAFWYRALAEKPVASIKNALLEYIKVGKYAPKPSDILGLINDSNVPAQQAAVTAPEPKPCPPEIHRAWTWFIGMYTKGSKMELYQGREEPPEVQERYLNIVNHEAQRAGMPEAIPDQYKLREVFGDLKTDL